MKQECYSLIMKVEGKMKKEFKFNKDTESLFEAVLSLKNTREAERFFRDLCTLSEIEEMTERWKIARLLDEGFTYRDISDKAGVSTTTVSRVATWLKYGKSGYKLALQRMAHHSSPPVSKKS